MNLFSNTVCSNEPFLPHLPHKMFLDRILPLGDFGFFGHWGKVLMSADRGLLCSETVILYVCAFPAVRDVFILEGNDAFFYWQIDNRGYSEMINDHLYH